MKTHLAISFGIAAALLLGDAAVGQTAQKPATKPSARAQADPAEVLCQRIVIAGSRIISKTYCMTRLQWQEQKAGDRDFTEKVQLTLQLRDGG